MFISVLPSQKHLVFLPKRMDNVPIAFLIEYLEKAQLVRVSEPLYFIYSGSHCVIVYRR